MRTIVLVNAAAGAVASGRPVAESSATEPPALSRLQEAVRQAGLQAEVVGVEPDKLGAAIADAAADPALDAVCVAGGDGTVSSAAAVMAGGEKPLGVLPLGTLNHFARDIGLTDAGAAAAAISAGHWRDVDVGEINGRINTRSGEAPTSRAASMELFGIFPSPAVSMRTVSGRLSQTRPITGPHGVR